MEKEKLQKVLVEEVGDFGVSVSLKHQEYELLRKNREKISEQPETPGFIAITEHER